MLFRSLKPFLRFPVTILPPITFTKAQIESSKKELPELPDEKQKRFETELGLPTADAEILTREKEMADKFEMAVKGIEENDSITARDIANVIVNKKVDPEKALEEARSGKQKDEMDPKDLENLISSVLSENTKAVEEYKAGKENAIMFLLGQTMRKAGKKLDANVVKSAILEALK